ncbi:hypothetical protein [Aureliella helgolandensis]|uniref:Uncharacterized protein n=1 Tax=Aureliella helgolandensis TaxID=2527968 RepID=A0A518G946_9BACT|nr:hypothetical protein [Aureliella helgolandensis]QDV25092.1 hypothetical protein Q31a_34150 [Aureliella helgolandensis]
MLRTVGQYLTAGVDAVIHVMQTMSVTQWGVVSVVFVVAGFMLLKTRF